MRHLLVTNDFPPKLGGIQSYLWELWRRLPGDQTTVLTTRHDAADAFDRAQPFRIERTPERVLLPTPALRSRIDSLAADVDAQIVLLDPALPVGSLGPSLQSPYGLVLHGAEVTVPGRLPFVQLALRRVLRNAVLVIAAGRYPADEARRVGGQSVPIVEVPPGVDTDRFRPLDPSERQATRERLGVGSGPLVVSVSRLVPRKGMDTLIRAVAAVRGRIEDVELLIGGDGRDRARLEQLAERNRSPTRFLGRVDDDDLPGLYGAADVFAMLCRTRWLGLEQEGFGIVFLEAAAAGTPQLAGDSGGAAEAVHHELTGLVIEQPDDAPEVARLLGDLLRDDARRGRMAAAGRARAESEFSYDVLAGRLAEALTDVGQ